MRAARTSDSARRSVEVVILAGGLSERMGRDKARLRLGGRSLLSILRQVSREAGLPCRVLRRDTVKRCGPLGGILTALTSSKHEACLFLSCDMPFITPSAFTGDSSFKPRRTHREVLQFGGTSRFPRTHLARSSPQSAKRYQRTTVQHSVFGPTHSCTHATIVSGLRG